MRSTHAVAVDAVVTLGRVVDNSDPESRGRVKVKLTALDVELWAPVAMLSAGEDYGTCFLPRKDEIVVVAFVEPELPIVLGALWSGSNSFPSKATEVEQKYTIVTPKGTRIVIDDNQGPEVHIETPGGNKLTLSDSSGGRCKVDVQGTTIEVTSSKVSIQASASVEIQAGQVKVSAGQVNVDAGIANFSGVVKCATLIAESVVGTSYTPGAGNIW